MTKPQEYREQRIVSQDTQYRADTHFAHGPQASSGVLSTGRVVWIKAAEETSTDGSKVPAYAEGIGIVALEAQALGA